MSITPRWPRSPRSASCAPRSNSNRDQNPIRNPNAQRSISKTTDGQSTTWRITLAKLDAAKFDAALQSHQDALIAEWKRDHDDDRPSPQRPPLPGAGEAFMGLVEAGWDAEAARRPHGQHTTVVVHVDVNQRAACACTWVRCSPIPSVVICCVTPLVRCGSNATAKSSARVEQRG